MHDHDDIPAASGAIASAAILTFCRWTSAVIVTTPQQRVLPPRAITIRSCLPADSAICPGRDWATR
jgi:hypothetical protein